METTKITGNSVMFKTKLDMTISQEAFTYYMICIPAFLICHPHFILQFITTIVFYTCIAYFLLATISTPFDYQRAGLHQSSKFMFLVIGHFWLWAQAGFISEMGKTPPSKELVMLLHIIESVLKSFEPRHGGLYINIASQVYLAFRILLACV